MSEIQRVNEEITRKQKSWGWTVAIVIALVASLALNLVLWQWNTDRADRAERTVANLAQQVQNACQDGEVLVDGSDVCEQAEPHTYFVLTRDDPMQPLTQAWRQVSICTAP